MLITFMLFSLSRSDIASTRK